jgi:hypothetical protein
VEGIDGGFSWSFEGMIRGIGEYGKRVEEEIQK